MSFFGGALLQKVVTLATDELEVCSLKTTAIYQRVKIREKIDVWDQIYFRA